MDRVRFGARFSRHPRRGPSFHNVMEVAGSSPVILAFDSKPRLQILSPEAWIEAGDRAGDLEYYFPHQTLDVADKALVRWSKDVAEHPDPDLAIEVDSLSRKSKLRIGLGAPAADLGTR